MSNGVYPLLRVRSLSKLHETQVYVPEGFRYTPARILLTRLQVVQDSRGAAIRDFSARIPQCGFVGLAGSTRLAMGPTLKSGVPHGSVDGLEIT